MANQYFLPQHVFLCQSAGQAIFLDLRSDQYLALARAQAQLVSRFVRGWPSTIGNEPEGTDESNRDSVAKTLALLCNRGLLTANEGIGKLATPSALNAPTMELNFDGVDENIRLGLSDVLGFLSSLAIALRMRALPLETCVSLIKERKKEVSQLRTSIDMVLLTRLVRAYSRLRPFFFTAKDACLFECLVLGIYLSRQGISPTWVFAVQANPFSAHCWLQHDEIVINDTLENIQGFAPIMSI